MITMKSDTALFVYARLDSSRLPNKAFKKICNEKLIDIVLRRASDIGIGEAILLTTDRTVDDQLASHVKDSGYKVIRGDAFNLVERTIKAIHETKAKYFFRINGDSPFIDTNLLKFAYQLRSEYELVTNLTDRTFPYGIAVELVNSDTYLKMSGNYNQIDAEHVTKHIYTNLDRVSFVNLYSDVCFNNFSLTIDTNEDLLKMIDLLKGRLSEFKKIQWWELLTSSPPNIHTRQK